MEDYETEDEKGFWLRLLIGANNVCAAIFRFKAALFSPIGKILHRIFVGDPNQNGKLKEVNS